MRIRTKRKQFEDLTTSDIQHIHTMMRQGIRIKTIIQQMNVSQKAINKLFERGDNGKTVNNLNNENNGNENTNK